MLLMIQTTIPLTYKKVGGIFFVYFFRQKLPSKFIILDVLTKNGRRSIEFDELFAGKAAHHLSHRGD